MRKSIDKKIEYQFMAASFTALSNSDLHTQASGTTTTLSELSFTTIQELVRLGVAGKSYNIYGLSELK